MPPSRCSTASRRPPISNGCPRMFPKQEAGRYRASELVLLRANRSVRLFDQVVAALAAGRQPDAGEFAKVGYLMRTTAVYGNGKFGIADRDRASPAVRSSPARSAPRCWPSGWCACSALIWCRRWPASNRRRPRLRLDRRLRRRLGIGNSTGLGLGPFVVNHPALFHRWILARETALARVRSLDMSSGATRERFVQLLARARAAVSSWITGDGRQAARIADLTRDLDRRLTATLRCRDSLELPRPWDALYRWAEAVVETRGSGAPGQPAARGPRRRRRRSRRQHGGRRGKMLRASTAG